MADTAGTWSLLLRPMLAACDHMRTGMRLLVLVVVLLIPGAAATVMYTVVRGSQIEFRDAERDGADTVRPMLLALADTVAGQTPDLDAVRTAAKAHAKFGLTKLAAALPSPGAGTPAERLVLAQALAAMITEAGNTSNLILDPDLDSSYVMDAQIVQLPKALVAAMQTATDAGTGQKAAAARAVQEGRLTSTADALKTDVATADAKTDTPAIKTQLTAVDGLRTALSALADKLSGTLTTGATTDPAAVGAAARDVITPLHTALHELLDSRISAYDHERDLVLTIALGGLVLAVWFAVAVVLRTTHDVQHTVLAVTAIAEGDLGERRLPGGRDEMGDIGRALAIARDRLQQQDTEIRGAQAAREQQLRATFLHQRQVEAQFRKRTQEVIDESTGVIAQELRLVTDQVSHVRDAAGIIDNSITTTDSATAAVVEQARQAERVITSLEQSLRRVASTAALVTGIAGQTRLLALNATIEAAKAGELGSGFTVVADEVKDLANHTANSTEQITTTINDLERDTGEMARTITTMIEGISSVGAATDSLRAVAADQDALVDQLSTKMNDTLDRVEKMSDLAAQLERRQHERVAASGTTRLSVGGRPPVPVATVNISSGGMRCAVPATMGLSEGDTVDVELTHDGEHMIVHANVVNSADADSGDEREFGLQFLITDEAHAQQLSTFVQNILDSVAA